MILTTDRRPIACDFEMNVTDVFAFEDRRTAFVGRVNPSDFLTIGPCECDLLVDGVPTRRFKLEGEMIHRSPEGLRSVTTAETVDVELIRRSFGRCTLRGLPSQGAQPA